jgi:hypothetical protein
MRFRVRLVVISSTLLHRMVSNIPPCAVQLHYILTRMVCKDPIFFLHHTQLDRIWWRWQQIDPSHQMQYLGPAKHHSNETASLNDILLMGDLAPGIPVKEVMSTESDLLCYRY